MPIGVGNSKFTPERVEKVLLALRAGAPRYTAARNAGIDQGTLRGWMGQYPEFAASVEEAEASFEVKAVATISKAGEKRWVAYAWMLERKWPERWGKVDRVEIYRVEKQAEQLVEELKAEGINVSVSEVLKAREALAKRAENAQPMLPAPVQEPAA